MEGRKPKNIKVCSTVNMYPPSTPHIVLIVNIDDIPYEATSTVLEGVFYVDNKSISDILVE